MKYFFLRYGKLLYGIIALLDLLFTFGHYDHLRLFSKPLLMPALAAYVMSLPAAKHKNSWFIIIGLLFAAAGDIFLLFDRLSPNMFIFGLVCFLFTHILYILYFAKTPQSKPSLLKQSPVIGLVLLAYIATFLLCLFPHLGSLKIPVIIYTVVIGTMFLLSIHAHNSLTKKSGFRFVLGALIFVLSDSLLAYSKFLTTFPFHGIAIMATYCIAQYLIAEAMEYL